MHELDARERNPFAVVNAVLAVAAATIWPSRCRRPAMSPPRNDLPRRFPSSTRTSAAKKRQARSCPPLRSTSRSDLLRRLVLRITEPRGVRHRAYTHPPAGQLLPVGASHRVGGRARSTVESPSRFSTNGRRSVQPRPDSEHMSLVLRRWRQWISPAARRGRRAAHTDYATWRKPSANSIAWSPRASARSSSTRHPAEDCRPPLSPDGRRIASSTGHDGRPEAHVMNADGSGQRSPTLEGS